MVSYETVKYFNAEYYEFNRYREAIRDFQRSEYTVTLALQVMNISQTLIFMLGLTIVCFIAAYQVSIDKIKVGKFVSLLTYMVQLQSPLAFFGTFYRVIQSSMIAAERLLELFKEQPTVVDKPGVSELTHCRGDIEFKDVRFAYDFRKDALKGMSFHCRPGTTTALVGESGGGKSTSR
jgi:ABC-type transport system involved in Fe-S cluster assembly fused permease/ATPase subunit